MKRRIFTMALACALALSLLSGCGGGGSSSSGGSASSQPGASSSTPDLSQPDASTPDMSTPDASAPDLSAPDQSQPDTSVTPPSVSLPEVSATLSLSKSDFTLKAKGASWNLKFSHEPKIEGAVAEFSSSDEAIATVAQDGTVTAVAPGTATITLKYGQLSAQCIVRCRWETKPEAKPEGDKPASGGGSSSSTPEASSVDLAAFYTKVSKDYEFPLSIQLADAQITEAFYAGLGAISTEQCLVYANQMSMNMGELVLVQVKNSKDVEAVKTILQTRIDTMINGGAFYPGPTQTWTESSKVVSNGNYIMMVVNEKHQSVVDDFNALFK